ncbi:hypothetical protein [Azotobacter chroococcum]|uniref:hypothetical protein n=1 Tax=Azotobacter chroococcum TaxID=353 RepID=UPI0010AE9784|nr:hypothetical protein [Azotobacter chroococcum]TKD30011.1 hypothetical protein FCG41_24355 [Azotobacter chroococcum]
MCNCYDDVLKKVTEKVKADAPQGSEKFDIELGGYLFSFGDGVEHRSSNPLTITYMAPKKSGGMKKVSQKSFVRASFCPFCGEPYAKAESQAA